MPSYAYVLNRSLAQGGRPPIGARLAPTFTTLVLSAKELLELTAQGHPNAYPDVTVVRVPIDDAKPSQDEVRAVISVAQDIAVRIRRGERVLVTCNQGRNRSGFIVAFTLMFLGMSANDAIARVQFARPNALTNPDFVNVLRAYDRIPKSA